MMRCNMPKLEVKTNKKLVLKNVIVHEMKNIKMSELEKELQKFERNLKLLNVQTFGPLITKNYGMSISDNGEMTICCDAMIQAHDYKQYQNTYIVHDIYTAEHCVYIRFEDRPEHLNYAYSKLDLFFYENDLESEGIIYSVLINQTSDMMTMDLFKPVKRL